MNKMEQKQIKQVREAVRQSCWYKLKKKLDNPWINFNHGPEDLGLEGEQQPLYLISKANLSNLKNELEGPHGYLGLAYRLLVEDVKKIANKRKMWQSLEEKEKRAITLSAYARTSEEATRYNESDEEYYQNQRSIGRIESELNRGSTEPEYNLKLLKRLRGAIKHYSKKIDSANQKPYAYQLKKSILERYLGELETIL
jgi:hypothetical protein